MSDDELKRAERGAAALDARAETANLANMANIQMKRPSAAANTAANPVRNTPDSEEWDALQPPPQDTPAMFYGPLGALAKQAASGTEVNPVAAMASALSWLGCALGRNRVIRVGDDFHRLNLFTLHLGRSSRGGKGTAMGLLKRVIHAIEKEHGVALTPQTHTGGLSSREGLAWLIHDGYQQGSEVVPAIHDKRLFVSESEFANVLAQGKRENNTLSTAIRDAWDGVSIKPAVKNCRVWASRPHISLHGAITPGELRQRMASNDLSNGFANRFLMIHAERTGVVPFPATTANELVNAYAAELAAIIRHGMAGYPESDELVVLTLDAEAQRSYARHYREFAQPHPLGETIAGLLQRRAPMLLRIAGILASADRTETIRAIHIEAARAWVDYGTASVAHVFATTADATLESHRCEDAAKLCQWLTGRGWQSRTAIVRDCFRGHLPRSELDTLLTRLAADGEIERREVGEAGRKKRTDYRLRGKVAGAQFAEGAESSPILAQPGNPADVESSPVRKDRSVMDEADQQSWEVTL